MGSARIRLGTLALVVALAGVMGAAGANGTGTSMRIQVVKVTGTGGGPPSRARLGAVSTSTGSLYGPLGSNVGTWTYRCRFIGGNGLGRQTSHFCSEVVWIKGKGTVTIEGGIGDSSGVTRHLAITAATGVYRGATGSAKLTKFNSFRTPITLYLIRG